MTNRINIKIPATAIHEEKGSNAEKRAEKGKSRAILSSVSFNVFITIAMTINPKPMIMPPL